MFNQKKNKLTNLHEMRNRKLKLIIKTSELYKNLNFLQFTLNKITMNINEKWERKYLEQIYELFKKNIQKIYFFLNI